MRTEYTEGEFIERFNGMKFKLRGVSPGIGAFIFNNIGICELAEKKDYETDCVDIYIQQKDATRMMNGRLIIWTDAEFSTGEIVRFIDFGMSETLHPRSNVDFTVSHPEGVS